MSKRVQQNIETGLEISLGSQLIYVQDMGYGELPDGRPIAQYWMTYHNGVMPAHRTERYATQEALVAAMREHAPIRNWRISKGE